MRKLRGFIFLVLLISIMFVGVASAASAGPFQAISNLLEGVGKSLEPLFKAIFGETGTGGQYYFAKILLLAVIFAIVFVVVQKITFFQDNDWAHWVVSIAVSILSVRWYDDNGLVASIILPYSVLGVTISILVPFVVFGYVVNSFKSQTARRVAWVIFGIVFIGLWATRTDMGYSQFYLYAAIASLVMIVLDGTFQKWIRNMRHQKNIVAGHGRTYNFWMGERNRIEKHFMGLADKDSYRSEFGSTKPKGRDQYMDDLKAIDKYLVQYSK